MSRLRARKLLSCLSESLYSEYKLESLKGTSRLPWSESGYPRLTGVLPGQSQRSATSWVCRALFVSARTSGYSDYRRDSAVSSIVGTIEFQNYSRRCKSTRSDHKKESIKKGKNSNDGVLLKLSMPAASLECLDRVPAVPTANENVSSFRKILLWLGGYYSKQSVLMRAAAELNECINEQALNENVLAGETLLPFSIVPCLVLIFNSLVVVIIIIVLRRSLFFIIAWICSLGNSRQVSEQTCIFEPPRVAYFEAAFPRRTGRKTTISADV